MTTSSLRRSVKNIVNNYTEAEIKVREATSNDPWGPSGSLMMEIAELTFNVVAFAEIMGIIWKRMNDHGKNWRHVYKALTLLDYLVKTGSERVAQQCKENIHSIQTLRDFQYIDRDGQDQGVNVREKAKQLVSLLQDKEKLKQERGQAQTTRERTAHTGSVKAYGSMPPPYSGSRTSQPTMAAVYGDAYSRSRGSPSSYNLSTSPPHLAPELEQARPQTSGEEELQLQLALAMSREESEKSAMLDLMDIFAPVSEAPPSASPWDQSGAGGHAQAVGPLRVDPWDSLEPSSSARGPGSSWAAPSSLHSQPWDHRSRPPDPWEAPQNAPSPAPSSQTWLSTAAPAATGIDPFSPLTADKKVSAVPVRGSSPRPGSPTDGDLFDDAMDGGQVNVNGRSEGSPELFDLSRLGESLAEPTPRTCRTPEAFLGPAAASLVNLDSLIPPNQAPKNLNPFLTGVSAPSVTNPFQYEQPRLTLSQMRPSSTSPAPTSLQYSASLPLPASNQPLSLPSSFTQPSEGHVNIAGNLPQPLLPLSSTSTSTHGQPDQSQNPFL
ncbi:epsin-3 isoform X5 [Pangasianodon hypophthalmus]|uniref:epsin-3 isoform X5 n=1 Tax=Pangasianodon hypophthalmus TaxID=310915 RepID=UPI000EFECBDC|nr:epsin-3 isoform X5 [Pangasianodon hypophthalmus]